MSISPLGERVLLSGQQWPRQTAGPQRAESFHSSDSFSPGCHHPLPPRPASLEPSQCQNLDVVSLTVSPCSEALPVLPTPMFSSMKPWGLRFLISQMEVILISTDLTGPYGGFDEIMGGESASQTPQTSTPGAAVLLVLLPDLVSLYPRVRPQGGYNSSFKGMRFSPWSYWRSPSKLSAWVLRAS